MPLPPDFASLILSLDTSDLHEQRRVSGQILSFGSESVPGLIDALRTGTPGIRKSAAYLLGALKDPGAAYPLQAALADEEPKVRQNAAVSLGKLGDRASIAELAEVLKRESIGWIRALMFLALGAIGGEEAHAALLENRPTDDPKEQEAHRKALDRTASLDRQVDWNPEGWPSLDLWVAAPVGLEEVAREEAASRGLALSFEAPGLLRCPPGTRPEELIPVLRCIQGMVIRVGEAPLSALEDRTGWEEIASALAASSLIRDWKGWLQTEASAIQYRLSLEGTKIGREALRELLKVIRTGLQPHGWLDSPSHYDVELVLRPEGESLRLFLRPSFHRDMRFQYRVKDVGASIHPVVGACLARLSRTQEGTGAIFDPMCGSGTLLIERAILGDVNHLAGLDISRTAVSAAKDNIEAAGYASHIRVKKGDARDERSWPDCREVLVNLPFGMRTRHEKMDLVGLYEALLTHIADRLQPHGRAVIYTAAKGQLNAALSPHRKTLTLERQFTIQTGGLWTHIWVLVKRS